MADWLAGWSQDIFTMENEHVRFAVNYGLPYGLPALVHLFTGHGIPRESAEVTAATSNSARARPR
ncbi:hypothetical protein G4Z16_14550 [Streptomyces bathyalis]|uniref:Uncharacterized protein n=1 Tax=Streptomyces bathyalis TaxID=2710756 RepID=A0A7T1WQK7_9ACTN|nr:hypothetical protein G4Z16_14550 [Streptomyces bathyalis]